MLSLPILAFQFLETTVYATHRIGAEAGWAIATAGFRLGTELPFCAFWLSILKQNYFTSTILQKTFMESRENPPFACSYIGTKALTPEARPGTPLGNSQRSHIHLSVINML